MFFGKFSNILVLWKITPVSIRNWVKLLIFGIKVLEETIVSEGNYLVIYVLCST